MNATPLNELLLHHIGCGKIEEIEVPKTIAKGGS
jgi:hypothetical protein